MSKKALGLDKFGVQKVMRKGDYFADSLGQFALNSIAGLVGQLTYFYTDKVGMAAGPYTCSKTGYSRVFYLYSVNSFRYNVYINSYV